MDFDHMWVRANQMHTFFSLIYFNYTLLYRFITKKFIVRISLHCTRNIQFVHVEIMLEIV